MERAIILSLYLGRNIQLQAPHYRSARDIMQQAEGRATKIVRDTRQKRAGTVQPGEVKTQSNLINVYKYWRR